MGLQRLMNRRSSRMPTARPAGLRPAAAVAAFLILAAALPAACSRAPRLARGLPLPAGNGPVAVIYPGGTRWVIETPQGRWQVRGEARVRVDRFPVAVEWRNLDTAAHELMFLDEAGRPIVRLAAGAVHGRSVERPGTLRFHLHDVLDLPVLALDLAGGGKRRP